MDVASLFIQPPHMTTTRNVALSSIHPENGKDNNKIVFRDHPKLSAIMRHNEFEYRDYKYTVYRCASKIVSLQKVFYTANIPYKLVLAILERHGIRNVPTGLMMPPFQLTSLIKDIYYACERMGHFTKIAYFHLETATAVLSNFFWNIFDPRRHHSISVFEIKVTFLLLCKLHSSDQIISEFYKLVYDVKSKFVTQFSFKYMVHVITKILAYIGEANAYGNQNIPLVMEECFPKDFAIGLTEYQFYNLWTTTRTRFRIYANLIELIKRKEDTEKIIHSNPCDSCRLTNITGIRFKCQTCKNLSLCMKCFATGYVNNTHQNGHRMYEVFTEDLPPRKLRHYFAKICNTLFTGKVRRNNKDGESKGFCNSIESLNPNETELVTIGTIRSSNSSVAGATAVNRVATVAVLKSKLHDTTNVKDLQIIEHSIAEFSTTATTHVSESLQAIIDKLLLQNTKLENQLKCINTSTQEEIFHFLGVHQQFLIEVINDMRNFAHTNSNGLIPTSSTPNHSHLAKTDLRHFNGINDSNLTHSINGADLNKSYVEANKSDYSLKDLSCWYSCQRATLQTREQPTAYRLNDATNCKEADSKDICNITSNIRDTEMTTFRLLLYKVKEIIEDSYSDNAELAEATQNLENVLDSIIHNEENRRIIT